MYNTACYESPLGKIFLSCDNKGLTGLWFDGQHNDAKHLPLEHTRRTMPVLDETKRWLDLYFAGSQPDSIPPLHLTGSLFALAVWRLLQQIPYGTVTTYGAIAKAIAAQRSLKTMSAQAVGGAVGHNPISIIVPCHRVIGANGSLTGYAGGMDKKLFLLRLEHAPITF